MSNIHKNFNSRTRVGATKKQLGGRIGLLVSIHAPVWVRLYDVYIVIGLLEFQFTHPCGCDKSGVALSLLIQGFNSRTRVGATERYSHVQEQEGFNSRTRVGATVIKPKVVDFQSVSIHAPVRVRRPDEYGLSIKHATKVLRQPDARTGCGQA